MPRATVAPHTLSLNPHVPPPVRVVCTNGLFHLVAQNHQHAGQLIFTIEGDLVPRPSRHSVQVGRNQHIDLAHPHAFEVMSTRHPWCFFNHSCDPNSRIAGRDVIALRAIATDEEITFDYNSTEWEMAEGFRCHCGTSRCRGEIRGYKFLSPSERAALGNTAAPHLTQR